MPPLELDGQRIRLLAFVMLAAALFATLLWAGTLSPNPAMNTYPDEDQVAQNPDPYVGHPVSLAGTVVSTEPLIIETVPDTGDPFRVSLQNLDQPVAVGDEISAFGTLDDSETLTVKRATVRSPWEFTYMYIISFLGGLLVLGRLTIQLRFDSDSLAFRPRGGDDA
jgi:hypothetical protein